MERNHLLALFALKAYTAERFDTWMLAGSAKARCRQHIMTLLVRGDNAKNLPQSQCGVTALRSELYRIFAITGKCEANREDNFVAMAKQATDGLTYAGFKALTA